MSSKDKDEEEYALVQGLTENVLYHLLTDNILLLSIWWSLKKLCLWQFSCKSKRCKRVHDQVDPKKLNGSKWGVLHDNGSNECSDKCHDIDCQLELQKSSDVVEHISAPHAGFDDRSKVIILDDYISSVMGHIGTCLHCETNISLF